MVLRIFTLIFCLLLTTSSFARKKKKKSSSRSREQRVIKAAMRAYRKDNLDQSLSIIEKSFNLKSAKTPTKVLELAATVYEKKGQYKNAQAIYSLLISSRYRNTDKKIMKSYFANGNADHLPSRVPKRLLAYYHFKIRNWTEIYKRDYENYDYKKMKKFQGLIRMHVDILNESDYDNDTLDKIVEDLDRLDRDKADSIYRKYYFMSLGYVTWKDLVTLISPKGVSTDIKSTTDGLNLCGGIKKENAHLIWQASFCFANAVGDVGNKTETIEYFQRGVAIQMFSIMPSVYWKPYLGESAIGLTIPLGYRVGNFTVPDGYQMKGTETATIGYVLEWQWLWKPVSFGLQMGKLSSFDSSYWGLNVIYDFK